ncbi:MAG: hypothetical protein JSS89_03185 [Bacteroidetes bacterium]|nr:hypothetical protein [Bacteroidota bacterium]
MIMRSTLLSAFLLASVLLASCGSYTDVYDTWANPNYVGHKWNKLVVVAMAKDPLNKVKVESEVVKALKGKGIDAVSISTIVSIESYDANSDGVIDDPNAISKLVQKIKSDGVDGAIMITLKGIDKKETYNPPTATTVPVGGYYGGYYGAGGYPYYNHYYASYQTVYTPGSTTTTTSIVLETKLYDLTDEKADACWIGRSSTTDPTSVTDLAQTFSSALVYKMSSDGVLNKK